MALADSPQKIDPLREALRFLRFTGLSYFRCELGEPWGLAMPGRRNTMFFHIVISGDCLLNVPGTEVTRLRSGDIALVTKASGHDLASASDARRSPVESLRCEKVSELYSILRHGGKGTPARLVCGEARFEGAATLRLAELLPSVIHLQPRALRRGSWEHSTFRFIAAEARRPSPGGEMVIARLADILVMQAIRGWVEREPEALGRGLGALGDPQLGKVIALMHQDPLHPWTLKLLASRAAMSRSAFAARFTQVVGEPPIRHLARLRISLSERLLLESELTLAELAHQLGYESEAAFNRAFRRFVGTTPGAFRKRRA